MPDVKKSLNVRKSDNEDSDVVGKLYKGDRAVIVEQGEEWTKITSGNVEGYVKNSYCLFGVDALAYAKENCDLIAKCTIDGLRVRKEPSLDGAVAGRLDQDAKLTVEKNADTAEGWIAVRYKDATCYVSADYVTVSMKLGTGVTLAEEAKAEAAQKSASSSSKSSGKSSSGKICDLAYEVDEVTLLAGIIECEAGGQDYDALLAVGAVVMNRVNSSKYPDTIFDVIHQKGQFPPATSGKLEKWLKKGPSKKAIKAAKAAIAGDDNTGGKLDFNSVSSGHSGTVIGDNVFY
jgi:spore germination cell wall hydrolase CwlJ-like protein